MNHATNVCQRFLGIWIPDGHRANTNGSWSRSAVHWIKVGGGNFLSSCFTLWKLYSCCLLSQTCILFRTPCIPALHSHALDIPTVLYWQNCILTHSVVYSSVGYEIEIFLSQRACCFVVVLWKPSFHVYIECGLVYVYCSWYHCLRLAEDGGRLCRMVSRSLFGTSNSFSTAHLDNKTNQLLGRRNRQWRLTHSTYSLLKCLVCPPKQQGRDNGSLCTGSEYQRAPCGQGEFYFWKVLTTVWDERSASHLLLPGWLPGLLFDPKYGRSTFLRNMDKRLPDYTASHPRNIVTAVRASNPMF
jgi:hypothetical protein